MQDIDHKHIRERLYIKPLAVNDVSAIYDALSPLFVESINLLNLNLLFLFIFAYKPLFFVSFHFFKYISIFSFLFFSFFL